MIPIRDTIPCRNYPVVNSAIIALNTVIYLVETGQGEALNRFFFLYGLVPARYSVGQIAAHFTTGQQLFAPISFMFLHGGFWHLLGNMWSLYIFGDNVEDRLGPFRYLLFYLLCGMASGFLHVLLNLDSNVPVIGASGAIAGVMGAYFILYPNAKILTLIPIFIIPYFIEISAFVFLGIWLLLQLINAAGSPGSVSGIAWWAHIGGFLFGIMFLKVFLFWPFGKFDDRVRKMTSKKKTSRLQVIRPIGPKDDPHFYGSIVITPFEALAGTHKLVNIPLGFRKRFFTVKVPAGVSQGTLLRLRGLGKPIAEGRKGDLLIKVVMLKNGYKT